MATSRLRVTLLPLLTASASASSLVSGVLVNVFPVCQEERWCGTWEPERLCCAERDGHSTREPRPRTLYALSNVHRRKLLFLSSPEDLSDFKPIGDWSPADVASYLRTSVVPRTAASVTFVAVALLALICFLLW